MVVLMLKGRKPPGRFPLNCVSGLRLGQTIMHTNLLALGQYNKRRHNIIGMGH